MQVIAMHSCCSGFAGMFAENTCTIGNRISLIYAAPNKWEGRTAVAAFVLAVSTKETAPGTSKLCRGAAGVSSGLFPPQQPAKHA